MGWFAQNFSLPRLESLRARLFREDDDNEDTDYMNNAVVFFF